MIRRFSVSLIALVLTFACTASAFGLDCQILLNYINLNNLEMVNDLIDKEGHDVNCIGNSHYIKYGKDRRRGYPVTPLVEAAVVGKSKMVQLLITKGADLEKDGVLALISAAKYGRTEVGELLIDKGVDIDGSFSGGNTPLIIAADNDHRDFVKMLIKKGADVNAKNTNGMTAIKIARDNGSDEIARDLRKAGAN